MREIFQMVIYVFKSQFRKYQITNRASYIINIWWCYLYSVLEIMDWVKLSLILLMKTNNLMFLPKLEVEE